MYGRALFFYKNYSPLNSTNRLGFTCIYKGFGLLLLAF